MSLLLLVSTVLIFWVLQSGPDAVQASIATIKPWLALWRLLLFALIIAGWWTCATMLAAWGHLDEDQLQRVLKLRWRFAGWLLVIEMLLVQNILGEFFQTLLIESGHHV